MKTRSRPRRRGASGGLVALLLLLAPVFVVAQEAADGRILSRHLIDLPPETADGAPDLDAGKSASFSVDSDLVQLAVAVTDEQFRPVAGLGPENFTVYEDGARQEILRVEERDEPISVGMAFDASGSVGGQIELCRRFVRAFIGSAHADDEYFLVEFASRPVLVVDFTTDAGRVADMVGAARSGGRSAVYDAVYMSLAQMGNARHKRKVLLLLSDGADNFSSYEEKDIRRRFYEQAESDIRVYTIGVYDPLALQYVPELRQGTRNMKRLAEMSGGRDYLLNGRRADPLTAVPEIAQEISRELRVEYEIGYRPSNTVKDGKWREVRVEVRPPEGSPPLLARTRPGYMAPFEESGVQ